LILNGRLYLSSDGKTLLYDGNRLLGWRTYTEAFNVADINFGGPMASTYYQQLHYRVQCREMAHCVSTTFPANPQYNSLDSTLLIPIANSTVKDQLSILFTELQSLVQ
jgi:hypothetical protein